MGLSTVGVTKIIGRSEVQERIAVAQSELTELIPQVIDNISLAVKTFKHVTDKTDKTIGWEATKAVATAHGLIGGNNMSVGTINITQNNNSIYAPVVDKFFNNFFNELEAIKDAVDVTPENG